MNNPENALGSGDETWANAVSAKWDGDDWTFRMEDSAVGAGPVANVTLYLYHYQSNFDDDPILLQIYDGSTWHTVETYNAGNQPPTANITNSWDVFT
ncbi:MAG: hypothetical protein JSW30_05005, partial [Dehalococcoidia bacterium]